MGPLDAVWHLLNFFAPAAGVALFTSAAAKLFWRRELAGTGWVTLLLWSALAGSLVLVAGLIVFGRDGRMATYGALVVAAALALWWVGFARR